MSEDFHLVPLPADADDLLEALGPMEERLPESQYCVFRSGRERFCLPVLDVEEVLDWPLLTKAAARPSLPCGNFQFARFDRAADRHRHYGRAAARVVAKARRSCFAASGRLA